jgi:nucleotidyltransferase/DNA polymerase involved in DNA repair
MVKTPKHPLLSLRSVGPASLRDMELLGIHTVEELAAADPLEMYNRLCALTCQKVDICQYDVFCCAVAQAQNPDLPDEQKEWHWWSRCRLAAKAS